MLKIPPKILSQFDGFEWDKGNSNKNFLKHVVSNKECEEIFFDSGKKIFQDKLHSEDEDRFIILGKTLDGRLLYIAFTARDSNIRVISARDVNKKEIPLYEKNT